MSEGLSAQFKGFPAIDPPIELASIPSRDWTIFESEFLFPITVLKGSALQHNIDVMADYCASHGASLAPHAKTTLSPEIVSRQLAAGAWGITAATIWQVRVLRQFGVERILLANELVEPAGIRWVAREISQSPMAFYCYVDSVAGVKLLDLEIGRGQRPTALRVLVELGIKGGRTGCRSADGAMDVAEAVRESHWLELAGTACFEGLLTTPRLGDTLATVDELLENLRSLTTRLDSAGAFSTAPEILVSAGGSAYFDRVVEVLAPAWTLSKPVRLVVRSGCYVTHDSGMYMSLSPLDRRAPPGSPRLWPAVEVWGSVLSRPEPRLAILGLGRRDVPFDAGLPSPLRVRNSLGELRDLDASFSITALNDQHAYMEIPELDGLAVGDLVGCGISHPCGVFERWRLIPLVTDEYLVTGTVRSFV